MNVTGTLSADLPTLDFDNGLSLTQMLSQLPNVHLVWPNSTDVSVTGTLDLGSIDLNDGDLIRVA
ncbi:hypothetical protein ACI4CV_27340, partial [Klebsiella pneumoniae]|uniref:hypothetical protein n=1 Tax=Klebsiella pneumoniae TaxID=573 RepID=UPI00385535E2